MPYSFKLTATIPASPETVYDAWLDSAGHTAMTGAKATATDRIGAEFSAWDGFITGKNIELVRAKRIVQSWRTSLFDAGDANSTIVVTLTPAPGGAALVLEHADVPDGEEHKGYEEGGWSDNYFKPMKAYFGKK